jgi:hypothetical protein
MKLTGSGWIIGFISTSVTLSLSITISAALSIYLSVSVYLHTALQRFVGPWPLFSFLMFYTVRMAPWTARPLLAHTWHHKQNERIHTPMPQLGFGPTITVFERVKTLMPKTARPPWSASLFLHFIIDCYMYTCPLLVTLHSWILTTSFQDDFVSLTHGNSAMAPNCPELNSQSQSHIAISGQSISKSWYRAPSGSHDQIFITLWQSSHLNSLLLKALCTDPTENTYYYRRVYSSFA